MLKYDATDLLIQFVFCMFLFIVVTWKKKGSVIRSSVAETFFNLTCIYWTIVTFEKMPTFTSNDFVICKHFEISGILFHSDV